ncbi:MAG: glycosyltransferase [Lachnospiraceae bacterium]|nr:glycosyltransferase [Lachnospiraceae bacterium]
MSYYLGKISIIIPVFNVEDYLDKCIDSILTQSYRNLEIFLIDDGSTDNSGKICEHYAGKDDRIKCIHQKNAGAAAARNAGLRQASGEYLAFVDSDDYLEADAYSCMIELLREYQADAVQCSFRKIMHEGSKEYIAEPVVRKYNAMEYLKKYTEDWTCGLLWDKLYRRQLFEGITFEEGHRIDDEFFTYQGMMNVNMIVRSPQIVYNYRQRYGSLMCDPDTKQAIINDKLAYLKMRREKVLACFPSLKQDFDYHYLTMLVILAQDKDADTDNIIAIQKAIKDYLACSDTCKMEFSLKRKLHWIIRSRPEKIVEHNNKS